MPALAGRLAIEDEPEVSTGDSIVPRYVAATLDNFLAGILGLWAAKSIDDRQSLLQFAALVGVYLAYFFVSESLTGRTLAKAMTGIVVVRFDGRRCSWRQALVRTLFRLVEVNPILIGALPAAVRIVLSKRRQRFGDRWARTLVVRADQL